MTESEYQILLAAIVEASDVRYDAAKVVLTKLMGASLKEERTKAFELVESELRRAGATDVDILYWDRGASETLSVYDRTSPRVGRGTLLTAVDALKAAR